MAHQGDLDGMEVQYLIRERVHVAVHSVRRSIRIFSLLPTVVLVLGSPLGCSQEEPKEPIEAIEVEAREAPPRDILANGTKRYSQFDEELIIRDFFQDKRDGFFVDVGAAWPVRSSTTFFLEKHLGWSGIAIDALEYYGPAWEKRRPRSKFFAYAITDHSGDTLSFFKHDWPSVSSLSREQAELWGGDSKVTEIKVKTITLTDLLDREGVTKIDHLTIDIEGAELPALAGFDIDRFQPEFVCIEGGRVRGDAYLEYFEKHGYEHLTKYLDRDEINWYFRRIH